MFFRFQQQADARSSTQLALRCVRITREMSQINLAHKLLSGRDELPDTMIVIIADSLRPGNAPDSHSSVGTISAPLGFVSPNHHRRPCLQDRSVGSAEFRCPICESDHRSPWDGCRNRWQLAVITYRWQVTTAGMATPMVVPILRTPQNVIQVLLADHAKGVQHLVFQRLNPRSTNACRFGDRGAVFLILQLVDRNTSSKASTYFVSWSRCRSSQGRPSSCKCIWKLRACWVVHSPVGFAVQGETQMRRVSTWIKTRK